MSDFQRDARKGCKGLELHDHESLVLNLDDQVRGALRAAACRRAQFVFGETPVTLCARGSTPALAMGRHHIVLVIRISSHG